MSFFWNGGQEATGSHYVTQAGLNFLSAEMTHLCWTPELSLDSDLTEGCAPPVGGFMDSTGISGREFSFPLKEPQERDHISTSWL